MTRAEQLIKWARTELGSPYIFGAAGQKCTPAYRQQVMQSKPEYAEAIMNNCPVLAGFQSACNGCKYEGRKAYDCRGLTREAIRAVTARPVMGAGATSQWKDDANWAEKGSIQNKPDKPCLVFTQKDGTMSHTGICLGKTAIHASGHNSGVIESPMPRSFTHYAIPVGLYEKGENGNRERKPAQHFPPGQMVGDEIIIQTPVNHAAPPSFQRTERCQTGCPGIGCGRAGATAGPAPAPAASGQIPQRWVQQRLGYPPQA